MCNPRTILAFVLSVTGGCSGGPDASTGVGVERYDSLGIEVVTISSQSDAFGPIGRLTEAPDLQLGSVQEEGPELFGSVRDVRQFSDGSIWVLDGQAREVRVFDSAGAYLRTLGGPGEGPGEFRSVSALRELRADRAAIWDRSARRLSVFGFGGELLSTAQLGNDRFPSNVLLRPDGSLIVAVRTGPRGPVATEGVELQRDSFLLVVTDSLAQPVDSLGVLPGAEVMRSVEIPSPGQIRTQESSAPASRGLVLTPHGNGIVGGPNDRFELHWWDERGELRRITRLPAFDRVITRADVEILIDRMLANSGSLPDPEAARRGLRDRFSAERLPEVWPAFGDALTSPDGVWVREHILRQHERPRWWLFEQDGGTPVGWVSFPPELGVEQIGPDFVIGVYRDELGVSHVQRYGLELTSR